MKKIITIFLICLAQYSIGQVIPQKITVLNSGSGSGTNKVDSATTSNDSLYYWINGSKHFGGLVGSGGSVTMSAGTGVTITGTGTSIDPYVINATGGGSGSNGGRYIIPEYGIIVDSSVSNQYKISVDSAVLKDIHYLKKPIYADGDTTKFNSDYTRDTLLNLAGGTTGQALIKISNTNGDWGWAAVGGSSPIDTTNKWVNNVVQQDDSTINVFKGGAVTPIVIRSNVQTIKTKSPITVYTKMGADLYDSIGITQAGASTNGFLSSADWNKFNSPPTNSSLVIRADSLGSNPTTNFPFSTPKGLYLVNYQPAASLLLPQSSPAIYYRGTGNNSNTNPFWFRTFGAGDGGGTSLYTQYSPDSSSWTTVSKVSNSSGLLMSVGSFTGYVSAPSFYQGTTAVLNGTGNLKLGNSVNNTPFAKLQLDDTTKGVLINRMSSNARIILGTNPYTFPITTGGTGYTIGAYSTTGGSGTGFTGSIQTVSSGAITSLRLVGIGSGYKVGDVLTIVKAGGSGGTITITQLQGDTGPGLMVYDTSVNKLYTWNVSYHGWKSVSGYIGSYSTTASAQSTFTVTLPENVFTASYVANMIPTSSLAAAPYYITNKTTTTFDVVFLSPITGSVTFDWNLMQP